MKNFAGKNIWIVGASSGIGEALALHLGSLGANLALSARREDKLNVLAKKLNQKALILPLDVANSTACNLAAKEIEIHFESLDSLIFLAAVYHPSPIEHNSIANIEQTFDINIKGAIFLVKAILPLMLKQGKGQLALCASVAGYRGLPNGQPYSASKAALINFAESLKAENSHLDIKILNPGFVKTPLTQKNDFPMPLIISAEKAAKMIAKGLQSQRFEIHFPKTLSYGLKLIRLIPDRLFFKLLGK